MNGQQRDKAIEAALAEAHIGGSVRGVHPLTGGCIHEVVRIALDDGSSLVAKMNSASHAGLFHEEKKGLDTLAGTNTVCVPKPIGVSVAGNLAVLVMEYLEPANATSESWAMFGEELACLHNADAGLRYGFKFDNHCGTTPQPNTWCDDWIEFNAEHRLGHQLRLARNAHLLDPEEARTIQCVIDRLDQFIPRRPKPALLHGDLWSGNALPVRDGRGQSRIAVIDPAPYIGDGWADIAMMRLFGGFSPECYEHYAANVYDHEENVPRIAVYQLYHVLNHVNLFGRGYAAQAMSLVRGLVRTVS